jgi:hypothetical protein
MHLPTFGVMCQVEGRGESQHENFVSGQECQAEEILTSNGSNLQEVAEPSQLRQEAVPLIVSAHPSPVRLIPSLRL